MPTPILRQNQGSAVVVNAANGITNNGYSNATDKLRIQNTGGALLADFRLTSVSFAAAPTSGSLQLVAVARDFAGNAGPAPSSPMLGRVVGTFNPQHASGNSATSWVMGIDSVPLTEDCDYWIFNNSTGYTLNAGWVLTAQPWSPGT